MEKPVVTVELEEAFNDYVDYFTSEKSPRELMEHVKRMKRLKERSCTPRWIPLYYCSMETIACIMVGWYEVEEEYKKGDWIVDEQGHVGEVVWKTVAPKECRVLYKDRITEYRVPINQIQRHATKREIMFTKAGRQPEEWKYGDIVLINGNTTLGRYKALTAQDVTSQVFWYHGERFLLENHKLECPVEWRIKDE